MQRPTNIYELERYVKNLCDRHGLDHLRLWGDTLMKLEHRGCAFDTVAILKAMAVKLENMTDE